MSDAAKLAWMLIYLQNCIDYLKQYQATAYEECGLDCFEKDLKDLEPIIQKFKDEKA